MPEQAMFRGHAELYDRIYSRKPYAAEAIALREVLRSTGVPDGGRVLEAACGTGLYLEPLAACYQVAGFDLNPEMLAYAERRVPDVPVWAADMAELTVDEPYDALVCLFSSFGYLGPEAIPRAARAFVAAVRPGGAIFVEPWFEPQVFEDGHRHVAIYEGARATPPEDLTLVRSVVARKHGQWAELDFHWLILRPSGVEHLVDAHRLYLATREELVRPFEDAGCRVDWLDPGPLTGRASLLAVKES